MDIIPRLKYPAKYMGIFHTSTGFRLKRFINKKKDMEILKKGAEPYGRR